MEKAKVVIQETGGVPEIVFTGIIDMSDPYAIIYPFLNAIHKKLVEQSIPEVRCNFMNLEFINSSGIKALVSWLSAISDMPKNKQYVTKIVYNKSITWQTTGLKTLVYLVPDKIILEGQ